MIDVDHGYGTVFGEYPGLPGYLVQPFVRSTGELVPFYHDGQQAPIYALATALAVAKTQSETGRLDFSVELELQSRNQAVAEVSSRSTIRRLLKPRYRISIDQGLQFLLLDLAAALVVQRPIKHAFGSAALGKEFDESEIQSMLKASMEEYVNRKRAWSTSERTVGIIQSYVLERHTKRAGDYFQQLTQWRLQRIEGLRASMLFYVMAHEISHIILGHISSNDFQSPQQELDADVLAAGFVRNYSRFPPSWWDFAASNDDLYRAISIYRDHIPAKVFDKTGRDVNARSFKRQMHTLAADIWTHNTERDVGGGLMPSNLAICITDNLNAVACLFAALDGAEQIENHQGRIPDRSYPPAKSRWVAFQRALCELEPIQAENCNVSPPSALGSPNENFSILQTMIDCQYTGLVDVRSP